MVFDDAAKEELFAALDKPFIRGITFSGGHPLEDQNVEEVSCLICEIKKRFPEKDIWVYTGYLWENISNNPMYSNIINNTDVVVDGKFIDEKKNITLRWRGSENQRVIDVKASLLSGDVVLINE